MSIAQSQISYAHSVFTPLVSQPAVLQIDIQEDLESSPEPIDTGWERRSHWKDREKLILSSIDWTGSYNPAKISKEDKQFAVEYITATLKVSYKEYITEVMQDFFGWNWFFALPVGTAVYFYQRWKLKRFTRKNLELFM